MSTNKKFLFWQEVKQVLCHPLVLSLIIGAIVLNYFIVKGIYIGPNAPKESDFIKIAKEIEHSSNYWDSQAEELNKQDLDWLYKITNTSNVKELNQFMEFTEDETILDPFKLLVMRQSSVDEYDYGYRLMNDYANNAKKRAISGLYYEDYLESLYTFKYDLFEKRTQEVLKKSSIEDLIYPEVIFQYHEHLYWDTLQFVLLELILITMVITILAKNNIYANHVEPFMITSLSGRKHFKMKQKVALFCQLISGVFITSLALLCYVLKFDYFRFAFSNISSVFNTISGIPTWPFVTWIDFNLIGYLVATVAFMLLITTWYCLFISGICNVYHSTLPLLMGVLLITVLGIYSPYAIGKVNWITMITISQPLFMIMLIGVWFTGAISTMILPMFETIVIVFWFIVLYFVIRSSMKHYCAKDHQEQWT